MYRIGIDVGGTFTDLALSEEDSGVTVFHKVPSTPHDPSAAIAQGMAELIQSAGISPAAIGHIGHGTTVATNLIIERKGARCALLTTQGFRDVLDIARQTRPHVFNYSVGKPEPLIPRKWRMEAIERIDAQGRVEQPLDEHGVRQAARFMKAEGIDALAIGFLHAYRNPAHEIRAGEIVRAVLPDAYVCLSSEVLPEFREYERFSTTALNAKIGPHMERYLVRFLQHVRALGVRIEPLTVHSNGGLMSLESVRRFPVRTCLSGPAAGVVGAALIGRSIGFPNLVSFDVGGTSTDVSLIFEGRPMFSASRSVAGYPVKTPMTDIHVIGAGGGSLASLDDAGSLKVGPQSAGAVPGPVGYGMGGQAATLTDAHIALHRLNPIALLDGKMPIHAEAAKRVMREKVATPLGLTLETAAEGVIRIANANMSRAIRSVSTERGYDLAQFALFAYGGAGPLHALDVAQECRIPVVIVPPEPGNMCARGILLSDISFDFVVTTIALLDEMVWRDIAAHFASLQNTADTWLEKEQVAVQDRRFQQSIDARYVGQNFEVQVPVQALDATGMQAFARDFHQAHQKEYGYHVPERPIEIINCRMKAIGTVSQIPLARYPHQAEAHKLPAQTRKVYFGAQHGWLDSQVLHRSSLKPGAAIVGPAVIEEMSATTVLKPGQSMSMDDYGNLIINIF